MCIRDSNKSVRKKTGYIFRGICQDSTFWRRL
jgi:hypothetical protein